MRICSVVAALFTIMAAVACQPDGEEAASTTGAGGPAMGGTVQMTEGSGEKSLYHRLGGYDVIAAIIDNLGTRVGNDPEFSRFFVEMDDESGMRGRQLAVDLLCQLTGGPCYYIGRDMKSVHAGLGITESDWGSLIDHMTETLDAMRVGAEGQGELLAIFDDLKDDIVKN